MTGRFHRPAPVPECPGGPSLAALVATMLLFDRDPSPVVDQVRAWLAEDEDRV